MPDPVASFQEPSMEPPTICGTIWHRLYSQDATILRSALSLVLRLGREAGDFGRGVSVMDWIGIP
jgi:hypothetical protein